MNTSINAKSVQFVRVPLLRTFQALHSNEKPQNPQISQSIDTALPSTSNELRNIDYIILPNPHPQTISV